MPAMNQRVYPARTFLADQVFSAFYKYCSMKFLKMCSARTLPEQAERATHMEFQFLHRENMSKFKKKGIKKQSDSLKHKQMYIADVKYGIDHLVSKGTILDSLSKICTEGLNNERRLLVDLEKNEF